MKISLRLLLFFLTKLLFKKKKRNSDSSEFAILYNVNYLYVWSLLPVPTLGTWWNILHTGKESTNICKRVEDKMIIASVNMSYIKNMPKGVARGQNKEKIAFSLKFWMAAAVTENTGDYNYYIILTTRSFTWTSWWGQGLYHHFLIIIPWNHVFQHHTNWYIFVVPAIFKHQF